MKNYIYLPEIWLNYTRHPSCFRITLISLEVYDVEGECNDNINLNGVSVMTTQTSKGKYNDNINLRVPSVIKPTLKECQRNFP